MSQARLPIVAFVILACSSANADWILSTYPTAAADSAQTNAVYGIQSVANKSSSVTTKVVAGTPWTKDVAATPGYVSLVADKIASDGTEGYSANVGLLHPLTPDWKEYDLTGLTGVSFEYQNTSKITEVLSVSLGSAVYADEWVKAGNDYQAVLSSATQLAPTVGSTWKKGEVAILDFATPTWWTAPANFPTIDSVLKRVKHLQFAPNTLYTDSGSQNGKACSKCVTPTMSSQTLNIRNIILLGVEGKYIPYTPDGLGCWDVTLSLPFSNFAEESPKSVVGGPFFAFSDFDSTGVSTEESKGSTIVSDTIVAGANEEASQLEVRAKLNKKIGGTYHKYSGWAGLGTNFGRAGNYGFGRGITGFGFAIGSLGINADRVSTIDFKVKMVGVSDTAVHFVSLPVRDVVAAGAAGKMACIRPSDLKQASYVTPAHQVAFNPAKIEQISWEAKITDNKQSSIDTATANFYVSDIKLYGIDFMGIGPIQGVNSRNHAKTFAAYSNGVLSLSGFSGVSSFDVTTLDGKVVASFSSAPRVSLALPRGTYLLTAKNGSLSQKFAVVGR
ncbi:MAG: hypothetical protein RL173_276 [Fibrobacterota bacterium]|jgi:hypothetical protein